MTDAERIKELEAERDKLRKVFHAPPDENFCLNCGRLTPCHLHREETAGMAPGKWPGSPCTFDRPALAEMRERAEKAEAERDKFQKVFEAIKQDMNSGRLVSECGWSDTKEALPHD